MKVIDTDILIDHFHGNGDATQLVRDWLLAGETPYVSVVTVTEILAGMRAGEETDTEALLSLFSVQAMDEPLARVAGPISTSLPRPIACTWEMLSSQPRRRV